GEEAMRPVPGEPAEEHGVDVAGGGPVPAGRIPGELDQRLEAPGKGRRTRDEGGRPHPDGGDARAGPPPRPGGDGGRPEHPASAQVTTASVRNPSPVRSSSSAPPPGRGRPRAPWLWGWRPVSRDAIDGSVQLACATASVKTIPCPASPSSVGLGLGVLP